ncbi:unnamed protein product [Sphenostylis stenocarpa]|uniref:F-box domain-containing protein n=1 Tax=Sphenostylis stenocarpa TaxID=92480 RepID=A0AA86SJ11_9FABA|nr:unnamed protein product [Sphenostylis stenocarpa]
MASGVPQFSDDVQREILSWLPVKNLLIFRSVSKTWNSLILHPTFVNLHLERSPKNTNVLITFCINRPDIHYDEDDDEHDYYKDGKICVGAVPRSIRSLISNPLSALNNIRRLLWNPPPTIYDGLFLFNSGFFVLGVCNGLICLRFSSGEGECQEFWVRFWNPATRIKSVQSPRLRVNSFKGLIGYTMKFGFGYDDSSETYKVVATIFYYKSKIWEMWVYCTGETCWRRVLTGSSDFPSFQIENGAFANCSLNWLALRTSLSSDPLMNTVTDNGNHLVIFSFDMKDETYKYMSIPDGLSEVVYNKCYLGVLNGCLCLSHDHDGTYFVLWEMRTQNSWTQLLKVKYAHLQISSEALVLCLPLCKSKNYDITLLTEFGRAHFVLLDQEDDTEDNFESFKSELQYYSTFLSFDYVESLVMPVQI